MPDAGADRTPGWTLARAGRAVALAFGAAWLVWLVLAQALLWTPLFRKLFNARWPDVRLDYGFAWSVWPGTVHARGFVIGKQDAGAEWQIGIDAVAADLVLADLRHRVFHATRVRARGLTFRLRPRLPRESRPQEFEGFPPIEGYEARPLLVEGPDDDPDDAHYRLITVWLEDVEAAGLRELWLGRWRAEGTAAVEGAVYYKPHRQLLVAPARVQVERFGLALRGEPVLADLSGRLDLQLGKIDPRSEATQVLHTLDLDLQLDGAVAGLGALGRKWGGAVRGGAGPLRATLKLRGGVLQEGARATISLGPAVLSTGRLGARLGALALELSSAKAGAANLRVEARALSAAGGLQLERALARLALAPAELPLPGVRRAVLDLSGGVVRDPAAALAAVASALARELRFVRGAGGFGLHLEGPPHALAGSGFASLVGARAFARGETVEADLRVDARIRTLDPARGADLAGTRLAIAGARVVHPDGEVDASRDWWGRFELPRADVRFDPHAGAPLLDVALQARCRDARPLVGLYVRRSSLPGIVSGLFDMDGLAVKGAAVLSRDWFALRDLDARGDGASIRATFLREGPRERGAALLTVRGFPLALDLDGGHASVHLFGPGDFYAEKRKALEPGRRLAPLSRARSPRRARDRLPRKRPASRKDDAGAAPALAG